MKIKSHLYFILFFLIVAGFPAMQAKEKTFTLVIDPGHGGRDIGAPGRRTNEKEINLAIALRLGNLIMSKHPDVKVVYTRKTDRFIELDERANIANRAKADLFISIHTNSVKKGISARGTETYTLGLARSEENLAVAMRENSAILLEDDYLQKYEGFDPQSSESYIIFEFMQNKHMEQSIGFASEIQKAFRTKGRVNRGVRQGGLLVLRKTSMPAVLVELGFISNPEEEKYMCSDKGRGELSQALYTAFCKYKNEYLRKQGNLKNHTDNTPVVQEASRSSSGRLQQAQKSLAASSAQPTRTGKTVFKIQILTSDKKLTPSSRLFKGYKNVGFYVERGLYKYTYGESTDFSRIKQLRRQVAKDFKDAFIVAFKDGQKVKY